MRILFQGDSITDCGREREKGNPNISLGDGYVMLIASRLLAEQPDKDIQIYNRGNNGNMVVDLYARWKMDCLNLKPDIISILVGVNDTLQDHVSEKKNGVELSRYKRIYCELLTWTVDVLPKTKIVLCEPFAFAGSYFSKDWLPEINQRRKVVTKLAKEFGTIFVPFQKMFNHATKQSPEEYWLRDGVHPSYAGHSLMTDMWLERVFI